MSGEELGGAMGKPIKIDLKGHPVFICCPSCKDELEREADKYLAKLGIATDTEPAAKEAEPAAK